LLFYGFSSSVVLVVVTMVFVLVMTVFVFVMMVFIMMAFMMALVTIMVLVTIIVVILAACSTLSREGAGSVEVGTSQGHGAPRQDTSD
jgi:hypothetical protein